MKSKSYEEFVEKFKPKKTTDDCYTPPEIYEVIKDWACKRYGIRPENIIRPFYPGGDYQNAEYPEDCVVLDNPPFSILTKICEFYFDRGIKFFLFAPSLTCLNGVKTWERMNHVICDCNIEYENGAIVRTSFVTNLDPDLIVTAAMMQRYAKYGVDFRVVRGECTRITRLDAQKSKKKEIFGTGLLLSNKAAAEKAAAERWELSEREKEIVKMLGTAEE